MGQLEGGSDRMPQNPVRPETEQRYEADWVGPLFYWFAMDLPEKCCGEGRGCGIYARDGVERWPWRGIL